MTKERPHIKIIMEPATAERPNGYLGAHTSYPAPNGEDYSVGNDLPDGPWNAETIDAVLKAAREVLEGKRDRALKAEEALAHPRPDRCPIEDAGGSQS